MELLHLIGRHTNPMAFALVLIILLIVVLLLLVQLRKDTYDLRYLILDTESKQPSIYKIGQLFALLVSTWGFVYLTLHDRLTEFYFTAYMSIWAVTNVGNNMFQKWLELRMRGTSEPSVQKDPQ